MLKKAFNVMECSRVFALPTTIFSWLIIFVYSFIDSGNVRYGLLTLVGLIFVHLGANLVDDFFDYKSLIKQVGFDKQEYLKNSQKTKCRYLINGMMKESDIIVLAILYFVVAALCGLFLFIKCGIGVLYFSLVGALIAILYPFLSRICLSEFAIAIAYGPALFGGVYYVMTGAYSFEVFLLCLPTTIMTVVLLYIHTVMDYEFDTNEGKYTIANLFDSQLESLVVLKYLLILAYISLVFLCVFDILDWQVFIVFLTIPLALDLYKSLSDFTCNSDIEPDKKWYHFPMENLKQLRKRGEAAFMMRIYQARNLMMYFSLFLVFAIFLSLAL